MLKLKFTKLYNHLNIIKQLNNSALRLIVLVTFMAALVMVLQFPLESHTCDELWQFAPG